MQPSSHFSRRTLLRLAASRSSEGPAPEWAIRRCHYWGRSGRNRVCLCAPEDKLAEPFNILATIQMDVF